MRAVAVLCCLLATAFAEESRGNSASTCFVETERVCKRLNVRDPPEECGACYGGAHELMPYLTSYTNLHIAKSFNYISLASNFGRYDINRRGFEKLFRQLSDSVWDDSIDLIKYLTKRGGTMDFAKKQMDNNIENVHHNVSEIEGLALALDSEKQLGRLAHEIHSEALSHSLGNKHEPEVASYLENKFLHRHADTIRNLAGHFNDVMNGLLSSEQKSLYLFLFDEHLKKTL